MPGGSLEESAGYRHDDAPTWSMEAAAATPSMTSRASRNTQEPVKGEAAGKKGARQRADRHAPQGGKGSAPAKGKQHNNRPQAEPALSSATPAVTGSKPEGKKGKAGRRPNKERSSDSWKGGAKPEGVQEQERMLQMNQGIVLRTWYVGCFPYVSDQMLTQSIGNGTSVLLGTGSERRIRSVPWIRLTGNNALKPLDLERSSNEERVAAATEAVLGCKEALILAQMDVQLKALRGTPSEVEALKEHVQQLEAAALRSEEELSSLQKQLGETGCGDGDAKMVCSMEQDSQGSGSSGGRACSAGSTVPLSKSRRKQTTSSDAPMSAKEPSMYEEADTEPSPNGSNKAMDDMSEQQQAILDAFDAASKHNYLWRAA
eukprot:gene13209-15607_t